MNLFVGISAVLMTMLLLVMIMPLSSDSIKITVTADEDIFKKLLHIKTNSTKVKVNGRDRVEDLMKNIIGTMEEKTKTKYGIELEKLSLQYGQNDAVDVLNDGETMDYYGIKKDDKVRFSIGQFTIVVQYQIKNDLISYTIWMNSKETVSILKKKIKNRCGIDPDGQILKADQNGDGDTVTVLEDKKTMKNYGIGEGTVILLFTEFEIVVKYKKDNEEKTTFTVWMKGTDFVSELRKKIMEEIKRLSRDY